MLSMVSLTAASLNNAYLFPNGVGVGPFSFAATLPQPTLHHTGRCLQVMMANLSKEKSSSWTSHFFTSLKEYLKVTVSIRENHLGWQRSIDNKLELASAGRQSISNINSDRPGYFADQATDLRFKVWRIIHNIDIGMTDPSLKWKLIASLRKFWISKSRNLSLP